jgi:hypothetical protein
MMGIITEGDMDKFIKNLIDNVGIKNAFKMVGDYNLVESYLTDEDKIDYIKDQFYKINDGNYFTFEQISQRPIQIKIEDKEKHQIEGLHRDNVTVVKYTNDGGIMKYYPKYEDLSLETIDKLFRMMISQYV